MHAKGFRNVALAAALLLAGAPGCSVVLDWDALTSGEGSSEGSACGDAPCAPQTLWTVPCHSVLVPPGATEAFVTRYGSMPEQPPGLYRVDLTNDSPTESGALLKTDGFPGAGIAGNSSEVLFATRDLAGSVWSVPAATPSAAKVVSPGLEAFGVAQTAEGDIYWVEKEGKVHAITAAGQPIDTWEIDGNPYYVAVHREPEAGGNVAYVAYNKPIEGQEEGQVARLELGKPADVWVVELTAVRGIAVRMLPRPDKVVVPHIFVVTSLGAKMAWPDVGATIPVEDLGGKPDGSQEMVPGEVLVTDTYAYWATRTADSAGGEVYRSAHHGSRVAEKLGSEEQAPIGVALVGDTLFWCSNGPKGLRQLTLKNP